METKRIITPSVLLILSAAFITSFSTYIAQPYYVIYYHRTLGFSSLQAGILIGVTPLCGALFGVVGGYLSDRIGVRKWYCAALLLSGFCLAGFSVLHSYALLMVVAVLMGLAMSTTRSGAQALLNARVPGDQAGSIQTSLYWLNNLAIVIGPPVAALLLGAGTTPTPFFVAAILMSVMALMILLLLRDHTKAQALPEESDTDREPAADVKHPSFLAAMRLVGRDSALLWTFIALLCYIMLEAQLTSTVPLYLSAKFAHGIEYYGLLNAEIAAMALAFTPLAVRITKKRQVTRVIAIGMTVLGLGLCVAGFSSNAVGWFVGVFLYGLGEVITMPKLNEIMAGTVRPQSPATYFAAMNSALFLGMFAGYVLGAPLYAMFRSGTLYACAFLLAIVAIYAFTKAHRHIQLRGKA